MENLSKSQSLAKRKLRKIQDTGITAFVIGVFFLFSPLFAGSNKILKPLAENLSSTVSWTFILIGVGLIGLYALLKQIKRKDKSVEVVKTTKSRTKSKPVGLLTTSTEQIPTLTPARSSVWSKQVFVDIEWRRFEAVCEGFYSQGKLKTKSQSHGADGGVDIWMYGSGRNQNNHQQGGYTNYQGQYNGNRTQYNQRFQSQPKVMNQQPMTTGHAIVEFSFNTRADAVSVINSLQNQIVQYGYASVADYYDLIGEPSAYTHGQYGWYNLSGIQPQNHRGGFIIQFPVPEVLR